MTSGGDRLQAVLEGCSTFLLENNLAPPKHQPYLVRWVRDFLQFAQAPPVRISAFGRRWGVRDACGGRRSSPLPLGGERAETSEASPG
jgi:hypothetical protein